MPTAYLHIPQPRIQGQTQLVWSTSPYHLPLHLFVCLFVSLIHKHISANGDFSQWPRTPYRIVATIFTLFLLFSMLTLHMFSSKILFIFHIQMLFPLWTPSWFLYRDIPFPSPNTACSLCLWYGPSISYYFKEYLDCKENTSQEHRALCKDQKERSPDCMVSLQSHDCEHGFSPPPRVSHLLEQTHSALSPRGPRMATVNNQETLWGWKHVRKTPGIPLGHTMSFPNYLIRRNVYNTMTRKMLRA